MDMRATLPVCRVEHTWLKPAGRTRGPVCAGAALLGAGRLVGMAWHTML